MENDPAIWSRGFARKIGELLGFSTAATASHDVSIPHQAEALLAEMMEDFRYLPLEEWNWIEHLVCFLGERKGDPSLEMLREVRRYVTFLRRVHGYERPADESDDWSDEDRRDMAAASARRAEETMPYEWDELPET